MAEPDTRTHLTRPVARRRALTRAPRLASVFGCIILAAACGREAPRPDIFLITADTLRADHLSSAGYARATTPALDAFAETAFTFDDAIALVPKTGPAFATIFTGQHPEVHAVRSNFEAIPPTLPTLAESLREAGYTTAAFVGNPVLRTGKGYGRGFDHYEHHTGEDAVIAVWQGFDRWSQQAQHRPVFVWIHLLDPHGPYTPPDALAGRFLSDSLANDDTRVPLAPESLPSGDLSKVLGALPAYQVRGEEDRVAAYVARYDAEILYIDNVVEQVLDRIRSLGHYDESVIAFTSDHGESLGEHDYYFEHGWFAYDATLAVPLLLKLPKRIGEISGLLGLGWGSDHDPSVKWKLSSSL